MIKRIAKKLFRTLGYDVHRLRTEASPFDDAFLAQEAILGSVDELTIFDVGAHQGETALRYRQLFPRSKIHSFEPFPESFDLLADVAHADPLTTAIPKAISDESGRRMLNVGPCTKNYSFFPVNDSGNLCWDSKVLLDQAIEVPVTTIDEYRELNGIENIDILKMDIQGAELLGLLGARDALRSGLVSLIYVEVMFVVLYEQGALYQDLSCFLQEYRYSLYGLYNLARAGNGQLKQADAIFLSQRMQEDLVRRLRKQISRSDAQG